ncbi:MAG: aminotransferase class V-fold PLP-dependent enzyme [Candidatus Woesearchaeota archaeon]
MFWNKKQDGFLARHPHIAYLDNACMTIRPKQVLDAMQTYYNDYPVCAGRSHHRFALLLDTQLQKARTTIATFLGTTPEHIIFVKNATEAINLVAHSLSFKRRDVILTSDKEHNSNLIPWLQLVEHKKVIHDIIRTKADNTFDMTALLDKLQEHEHIKLLSLVHSSNIDGVAFPIKEIVDMVKQKEILVMVDGAQAVGHMPVDVQALGVDFYAISAHKMYGPSGIGALYVKDLSLLDAFMVGGDTVQDATYTSFTFKEGVHKYEAGLQYYPGILGFAQACKHIQNIGFTTIQKQEKLCTTTVIEHLEPLIRANKIRIIGPAQSNIVNVHVCGMDQQEVAQLLDKTYDIIVRAGMHCVHSWYHARGINGSVRASFSYYNTVEQAKRFAQALQDIIALQ